MPPLPSKARPWLPSACSCLLGVQLSEPPSLTSTPTLCPRSFLPSEAPKPPAIATPALVSGPFGAPAQPLPNSLSQEAFTGSAHCKAPSQGSHPSSPPRLSFQSQQRLARSKIQQREGDRGYAGSGACSAQALGAAPLTTPAPLAAHSCSQTR